MTESIGLAADFLEKFGPLQDRGWSQRPDGLLLPPSVGPEPEPQPRPIGVDLFAGCGGFSLGFEQAGFDVVSAAEADVHASATYLVNLGTPDTLVHVLPSFDEADGKTRKFCDRYEGETVEALELVKASGGTTWQDWATGAFGYIKHHADEILGCEHFYFGDVRALTGARICADLEVEIGDVDCVFGGPPCQGFSVAGQRNVHDPRSSLVFEFARVVCEVQPRAFVMENVPGILSMTTPEGIPIVDALSSIFEKGGMGTFEGLRKMLGGDNIGALKGTGNTRKPKRNNEPVEIEEANLDEQLSIGALA